MRKKAPDQLVEPIREVPSTEVARVQHGDVDLGAPNFAPDNFDIGFRDGPQFFSGPLHTSEHFADLRDVRGILSGLGDRASRSPWDEVSVLVDESTDCVIVTGRQGPMSTVIDPMTFRPLSHEFHEVTAIAEKGIRTQTDARNYVLSVVEGNSGSIRAEQIAIHEADVRLVKSFMKDSSSSDNHNSSVSHKVKWGFPTVTSGQFIVLNRDISQVEVAQVAPINNDPFKLTDKDTHPSVYAATEVYESAMNQILAYAAKNKPVKEALKAGAQEVRLPRVHVEGNSYAQLSIYQNPKTKVTQIILEGQNAGGVPKPDSGVYLSRDGEGHIFVVPVNRKEEYGIEDPAYLAQIKSSQEAVDMYFNKLGAKAQLGDVALNSGLDEISVQLAEVSEKRRRISEFLPRITRRKGL